MDSAVFLFLKALNTELYFFIIRFAIWVENASSEKETPEAVLSTRRFQRTSEQVTILLIPLDAEWLNDATGVYSFVYLPYLNLKTARKTIDLFYSSSYSYESHKS